MMSIKMASYSLKNLSMLNKLFACQWQLLSSADNFCILLLGVSYIAESQTGLYLVTYKFTVIGVLNSQ